MENQSLQYAIQMPWDMGGGWIENLSVTPSYIAVNTDNRQIHSSFSPHSPTNEIRMVGQDGSFELLPETFVQFMQMTPLFLQAIIDKGLSLQLEWEEQQSKLKDPEPFRLNGKILDFKKAQIVPLTNNPTNP